MTPLSPRSMRPRNPARALKSFSERPAFLVSEFGAIEKLRREHLLDRFDCGKEDLNRFLIRQAWNNQQAHSAQTYVSQKTCASSVTTVLRPHPYPMTRRPSGLRKAWRGIRYR